MFGDLLSLSHLPDLKIPMQAGGADLEFEHDVLPGKSVIDHCLDFSSDLRSDLHRVAFPGKVGTLSPHRLSLAGFTNSLAVSGNSQVLP